jgi:hypothetical protein
MPDSGYLPLGEHIASWSELVEHFGWNATRRAQLDGLHEALTLLAGAGCTKVWINGSFVTAKDEPGDFDAVWDSDGVNEDLLDPLFYDLADGRIRQKLRFRGELFPNWINSTSDSPFADFFQQDRHGRPKGIVVIDPREVSQ